MQKHAGIKHDMAELAKDRASVLPSVPMMSRTAKVSLALSALLCGMLAAKDAHAIERQHHLGIGTGVTLLGAASSPVSLGGAVGAFYTYGLTDQFNLLVEGSFALQSVSDNPLSDKDPTIPKVRPRFLGGGAAGLAYVLDVLQWVPYGGLLIGVNSFNGGTLDKSIVSPDAVLALGLDYQVGRKLSVGGAFRQHFALTQLSAYPSYTQLFVKLEYTWGY